MEHFISIFIHYCKEIVPALLAGFFISGIVHEAIPESIVLKYLGSRGIMPVLASTIIGTLLPVCCWGSLPIAVSFYKKGASLGPILAFLVATPATSISALLVSWSLLGPIFTCYTFFSVIIMGVGVGLIGDKLRIKPKKFIPQSECLHCKSGSCAEESHKKKSVTARILSAMKYAFIDMPREIGLEVVIGIALAALVSAFVPLGELVYRYLSGYFGYVFSIVAGVLTYFCSTASVPLIDSLIQQGMNSGAAMTLLLIGPITSYGTMLVLRKEYGIKVLIVFLAYLIIATLLLGLGYQSLSSAN